MDEPKPDQILQVGLGFWPSKALLSAVEMGLFTELAEHPENLETLQGRLGLHPRSARDFLDALVALKFLERREGKYFNTPATDWFLDKRKPSYIGGILEIGLRAEPEQDRNAERMEVRDQDREIVGIENLVDGREVRRDRRQTGGLDRRLVHAGGVEVGGLLAVALGARRFENPAQHGEVAFLQLREQRWTKDFVGAGA